MMKEKMKARRPVALRTASRPATTSLPDRRRGFFKDIQDRLQGTPDHERLPQAIQDDIKKYSRSQNSEKVLVKLTDYPVFAVRQILSALLQDIDGNISNTISNVIKEIKLNNNDMKYMSYDNQLKHKLNEYVEKNLSKYLPTTTPNTITTDVSMEQLQKDLSGMFEVEEGGDVVGDVFGPLFHSFTPEEKIKLFLATIDPIKPLQHQVSNFVSLHRFDLIRELFEKGFQPTSPQDWKDALPEEYYNKFPSILWQIKTWGQLQPFIELSKRYSLDIHDFIKYSFYRDHERLIRLGQEIRSEKRLVPIHPSKHAPFMTIYDENELMLLQRTRPWVDGLVAVLIKPIKNCELYMSKPYGGYYFTTDTFYKDLINPQYKCSQEKKSRVFSITHTGYSSQFYVHHLLRNGQIVPQTFQVYEKGVQYMTMDNPRLRIPKIEEYFLSLPFHALSNTDQDFFRNIFTPELSFFLTTVFDDKMDFDGMASDIVSSVLTKMGDKPLKECLGRVFQLYFLFSPRYNMSLLSNVINERMNLFFYNLENLDEAPIEFYHPQYHFLEEEQQKSFDRWHDRCKNNFIIEKLYYLFIKNYPSLRVKMPDTHSSSFPPKTILLNVEMGEKLSLLHPYHNHYIHLPEVAESIIKDQEYLIDGKPLPAGVVSSMEYFFDLERVRSGFGSYLMDNQYEILTPIAPQPTITKEKKETDEEDTIEELETLPDFKEKAFQFLDLLSAS